MTIGDAQRDVRQAFAGGFSGQLVSAVLWVASAAAATWIAPRTAIIVLVVGGAFIFPVAVLLLRLSGNRGAVAAGSR